jgi:3-phenylpropionate/cinnamic acid dioxygenase small subunit
VSDERDRSDIIAVLDAYAEALDSRRWNLLREAFCNDAHFDFGEWTATTRTDAIAAIRRYLDACGPTQHLLGNYRIAIDGDQATSRVYVRAFHLGIESAQNKTYEMGGEYQDELIRTKSGWRIAKRKGIPFWEQGSREVLGIRQS